MTTALPEHVSEGAFWADWFCGERTLIEIAIQHSIPLLTLIAWARGEEVRRITESLREVAAQRAEDVAALAEAGAIAALAHQTAARPETPLEARIMESRRKAASALLPRQRPRPAPARSIAAEPPAPRAQEPQPPPANPPPQSPLHEPPAPAPKPVAHTAPEWALSRRLPVAAIRERAGAAPAPLTSQPRAPG